jgi:hypothetical protein
MRVSPACLALSFPHLHLKCSRMAGVYPHLSSDSTLPPAKRTWAEITIYTLPLSHSFFFLYTEKFKPIQESYSKCGSQAHNTMFMKSPAGMFTRKNLSCSLCICSFVKTGNVTWGGQEWSSPRLLQKGIFKVKKHIVLTKVSQRVKAYTVCTHIFRA